jgi:diguanylate cyclase (GGDEF)-like protein
LLACVLAYALAASVEYEIGPGVAIPTEPVLVVTLFLVAPPLVPVVALAGLAAAATVRTLRHRDEREDPFVVMSSAWHAMGPAVVFAAAGVAGPTWSAWPVYMLALGAQFGLDAGVAWVHNCWALAVPARTLRSALVCTYLGDAMLAPLGLAAAIALPNTSAALLVVLPVVGLLAVIRAERSRQINHSLSMAEVIADTAELARKDPLTGTRNRLAWEEALRENGASAAPFAIVLADVDRLKQTNDTHGYETGDELIIEVANLLAGVTATIADATLFRIGGDEFAVVVRAPIQTVRDLERAFIAVLDNARPLRHGVGVSASIGIDYAPTGTEIRAALRNANDLIMQRKAERRVARV